MEFGPRTRAPRGSTPYLRDVCLMALAILLVPACQHGHEDDDHGDSHHDDPMGVVTLSPEQQRAAGIGTRSGEAVTTRGRILVPGSVETPDTARMAVGSIVEGRVEQLLVLEGDVVVRGAPLLRIHSHELAEWRREWDAARAQVAFAEAAVDRAGRLVQSGALSRSELERRELELAVARADEARARDIVAHLHPDGDDVTVPAPRSGTVFRVRVSPGEAVVPGTPLVDLGSTAVLWVVGQVPEGAALALARGDSVELTFPALPGTVGWGRVVGLGSRVDPVLRTVEARVQLVSPPAGIRPGSLGTLLLPEGPEVTGVRVPHGAVQGGEGGYVVFVEEGAGQYRPVEVSLLLRDGAWSVVEGISPGDRVVVEGAYSLRAVSEGLRGRDDDHHH